MCKRICGIILMLFLLNGCVTTIPNKDASTANDGTQASRRDDKKCFESIALASSCLIGTGLLSNPFYVQYSSTTNNEDMVDFYEADKYNDIEQYKVWPSPSVRIRIKEDIVDSIRIEGSKSLAPELSSDHLA